MLYVSKGFKLKKKIKGKHIIYHFGSKYMLDKEELEIWKNGLGIFASPMTNREMDIVIRLKEKGLVETSEGTTPRDRFFLLNKCIVRVLKRRGHVFFYPPIVKEIWQWLNYKGERLSLIDVIYLKENKISPTPELLKKGNEKELMHILHPCPITIGNERTLKMAVAFCRDDVVQAFMFLVRKGKIYLI